MREISKATEKIPRQDNSVIAPQTLEGARISFSTTNGWENLRAACTASVTSATRRERLERHFDVFKHIADTNPQSTC